MQVEVMLGVVDAVDICMFAVAVPASLGSANSVALNYRCRLLGGLFYLLRI